MKSENIFKIIASVIFSIILFSNYCYGGNANFAETAILSAMKQEMETLKNDIEDAKTQKILGLTFISGKLKGRSIVLAQTGVGKVNASIVTTLTISHFNPKEIIFTGIAGGINSDLLPGDIIIGDKSAQHDLVIFKKDSFKRMSVRNPINGIKNPIYFCSDNRLLKLAETASSNIQLKKIKAIERERKPIIKKGIIVSGDAFIASSIKKSELQNNLRADAVEMEGAAVAQVCHQFNIPFLLIRSISDKADKNARENMNQFYKIAAENSGKFVIKVVELIQTDKNS